MACFLLPMLPAQVALGDVPKLARDRAERARPAQEKALEPFWADLALDYRNNQQFLDQRIAQAAALGDSVVPMLLEKLQPTQGGETARNLAGNCRRVIEKLDPSSFTEALVELVNGKSETARQEAIRLLGFANTPAAIQVLCDLIERTTGEDRRLVLRSLRLLKTPAAATKVVGLLGSTDRQVREDVLSYLIAARPANVADTVVQALSTEKDSRLLPSYIEYFATSVTNHDGAARALLSLIGERLDWQDTRRLVQALGSVAPRDHEPTCRRLHEMLDTGEATALAVQAAVTLRNLGDRQGVTKLKRTLDEQLRKPQRKRDPSLFEQRANLSFAIEEFGDAAADYEKILEFSDGLAMTRRAYIGLIRSEAHRKKVQNLIKAMKASGMTTAEIEAVGVDDQAVQDSLGLDKVRSFLQALAKEQAPK
jgi:HEAT repeat protein